jgi:formate C-acetyltransferase
MAEGGLEVQFNVVDSETLRNAQKTPDAYRNLIVRVWGFSAYFVTLTKDYQDNIIARTAHGL